MLSPRAAGYLVHLYTASGVVLILAAALLIMQPVANFELALALMLGAVFIDATDGILARRANVKKVVPEIDGRSMDDVIDYAGYVFVPVLLMIRAGLLLDPVLLWGALPLVASAFGFAQVQAKIDEEGFFVGFPSYWNIVAFYLYQLAMPPLVNTLVIVGLAVLVFVPTRYLYITRFPRFKRLNYILSYSWGALVLAALFLPQALRGAVLAVSLLFPIYYTTYSLVLDRRARMLGRIGNPPDGGVARRG
jgi:phosphatidylcholine synthase